MNALFLQRMVGTAVIAITGFTVLPAIFSGKGVPADISPTIVMSGKPVREIIFHLDQKAQHAIANVNNRQHFDVSVSDASSAEKAWVVQLASFKNHRNAKALVSNLQDKAFHAFSRTVKNQPKNPSKAPVTRVYVGPELELEKAKALVRTLNNELGLKGMLVSFNPRQG